MDTIRPNDQDGNKQPVIPDGMKQCRKCLSILPATTELFIPRRKNKDGLYSYCRQCEKETSKAYYETHKEQASENGKKQRAENPEKKREKDRKYREEHKEEILEKQRQYYEAHREELAAKSRAYQAEHREERRAYHKKRYAENREERCEYIKNYNKKHKDKRQAYLSEYYKTENGKISKRAGSQNYRALKRNASGKHTTKELREQFTRQKEMCYYCKTKLETSRASWHADHIIPISRGGSNDIHNIVITCPTCNLKKGKRMPHEWDEGGHLL